MDPRTSRLFEMYTEKLLTFDTRSVTFLRMLPTRLLSDNIEVFARSFSTEMVPNYQVLHLVKHPHGVTFQGFSNFVDSISCPVSVAVAGKMTGTSRLNFKFWWVDFRIS
jgi:hypothetical protein